MMFFVRMIRLVPLVVILLVIGLVIYLVAQAKYSPNRAKAIVIKVSIWVCSILTAFFLLWCIYAAVEQNIPVLELFLSFATVPAVGLLITLLCRAVFYKHHPKFKREAKKTNRNETFVEFWKKRITKFITELITKNIPK